MGAMASQITSLTIVYSTVYSGAGQSKHQSSASLAFLWGIRPVNSPHKWPVTRKMFPFDDVIMSWYGNGFGITGHLLWESNDQQWIPPTKCQYCGTLMIRYLLSGKLSNCRWFEMPSRSCMKQESSYIRLPWHIHKKWQSVCKDVFTFIFQQMMAFYLKFHSVVSLMGQLSISLILEPLPFYNSTQRLPLNITEP